MIKFDNSVIYAESRPVPSAETSVVDLLSAIADPESPICRDTLSLAGLLRFTRALGHSDNSVRMALSRLVAEDVLKRDGRGCYAYGSAGHRRHLEIAGWRTANLRVDTRWDGSWLGLFINAKPSKSDLRAARLAGFKLYSDSLMVRPGNLSGGLTSVTAAIPEGFANMQYWAARLSDVTNDQQQSFRALYDSEQIMMGYNALMQLELPTQKVKDIQSLRDMVATTYVTGREAVVSIVSDPLLPKEMIDVVLRANAIKRAKRFYDQSSKYWAMLIDGEFDDRID
jgi:phenylacetic acid degradation operon negative regulatory protein